MRHYKIIQNGEIFRIQESFISFIDYIRNVIFGFFLGKNNFKSFVSWGTIGYNYHSLEDAEKAISNIKMRDRLNDCSCWRVVKEYDNE